VNEEKRQALHQALDKVLADVYTRPVSVRVEIGNKLTCLMGNKLFDPSTLYFKTLPDIVHTKIVLLKMLRRGESITNVGKRLGDNVFYVYISPIQWAEFKDEAVPML